MRGCCCVAHCCLSQSCNFIVNTTLSYCSNPEAGLVNYTSCISTKDLNGLDSTDGSIADARAFNNSKSMPSFSDDPSCTRAKSRLLCALLFPKCIPSQSGNIISQPVCTSTCVNFFVSCNVALSTQCQFTEGTGPSNTCTGFAIPAAMPAFGLLAVLMMLVALLA